MQTFFVKRVNKFPGRREPLSAVQRGKFDQ